MTTAHLPPLFLKLISHDIRWQILQALTFSDFRVQELVQRLGQPQNLISYHLHKLREKTIIHERRSAADRREVYYSLDIDRLRADYFSSGNSLHPALNRMETPQETGLRISPGRVLFLCTHNSARSQMAEAILRSKSNGAVEVQSAGTEPSAVHPLAIRAMAEMNIDIRQHRSKHIVEYTGQSFDYIITVCDRAREACPVFPGDPVKIHWSFPDPAAVEGSETEIFNAFKETAVQLNTRIGYLLMVIQREGGRRA